MADAPKPAPAPASCCHTNTIKVEPVSNSGTNGTCISTPHIVQYPKVPRRDDGKWMALGSIIGGLIGKFANEDKLNAASDAEDVWRDLNDKLKAQGLSEWARVPEQRAMAADADGKLKDSAERNYRYALVEMNYSDKLKACDDALHDRLCALANCGYVPDYTGILSRVKADAAAAVKAKRREMMRTVKRYSLCAPAQMCVDLAAAEVAAVVGAASTAREAERQAAWKYNWDTLNQAVQLVEGNRLNRAKQSQSYDNAANLVEANRYAAHTAEAEGSIKTGGDFLSSAGQNYAWLAESLRRSAEKDTGNFSALGALIIPLLLTAFGSAGCALTSVDCDCK